MNLAVSSFRSHTVQTGNGMVQNCSPKEKNVVSTCNILEPHFEQCTADGSAVSESKSSFT